MLEVGSVVLLNVTIEHCFSLSQYEATYHILSDYFFFIAASAAAVKGCNINCYLSDGWLYMHYFVRMK